MLFVGTLLSGNFNPNSHLLITPLIAAGTLVLALVAVSREMNSKRMRLLAMPVTGNASM
jgi:hypothetical protein